MARPKSVTDEEIKGAARAVFVAHGPSAPVSLIAKRLGVSHAALFGRAGSKAQLMMDALCPERPRAMERLGEPPPEDGVHECLADILEELMVFFQRVVPNLVVLKAAGHSMDELPAADGPPPPVALRCALADWLAMAAKAGAVGACEPTPVAEGLLGAMEARCFNAYLGGDKCAPDDDAAFIGGLVAGLVPAASVETTP